MDQNELWIVMLYQYKMAYLQYGCQYVWCGASFTCIGINMIMRCLHVRCWIQGVVKLIFAHDSNLSDDQTHSICETRSIPWLLMPWLLASPGDQQPWYWPCEMYRSLSSIRNNFNYLPNISAEKWQEKRNHFYVSWKEFSIYKVASPLPRWRWYWWGQQQKDFLFTMVI